MPAKGDGWELALDSLEARRARLAPRARTPARRGDGAPAQRARLGSDRSALRARGSEHGGARAPVGLDRRGDRARLRRAARDPGARAGPRPRRGGARAPAPAHEHRPRRPRDPDARRLPPRPGALDERGRLADPRLRGRAGAVGAGAAPEDVPAPRRRRDAPLVRLRGIGREDPTRRRSARGLGGPLPQRVPRGLPRHRRSGAPASEPRPGRAAADRVRAREGGLRAPLRAPQPARLGRDPVAGILRMLEQQ